MKIALLSAPWIAIPPQGYGGIEQVVANLTEGLVKRGHDVMLFATGDSKTSARLEYEFKTALGNNRPLKENEYIILNHCLSFFRKVREEKFDIIHNHAQYIPIYFADFIQTPIVHTLHGAYYESLNSPSGYIPEKRQLLEYCKNHNYISISNFQRTGMLDLNYVKTVYNGIHTDEFKPYKQKGKYLAWLGRITYNKGLDIAIKVAKRANLPLKIGAFLDDGDRDYFNSQIKPLLDPSIEMIGEIKTPEEKNEFLGNALATLFPIRWHEPFGLVMVESMASGTPVLAFHKGSVAEVVEHSKTGFIVENEDQMVEALKNITAIDRTYCHTYATQHFSVDAMVEGYLDAYSKIIDKRN